MAGQAIARLAARQYGIISVLQLRAMGLDRYWVRRRVESGLLHHLYRGVYSVGVPQASPRGRYLAAVWRAGPLRY